MILFSVAEFVSKDLSFHSIVVFLQRSEFGRIEKIVKVESEQKILF